MKWLNKFTALNFVLLFALAFSVVGCGTALSNLSPIQPVHNIAKAKMEQSENPNAEVVVPAVPAEPPRETGVGQIRYGDCRILDRESTRCQYGNVNLHIRVR